MDAALKERIGSILNLFWKNKISQIPVLEKDKIVDVLNTNTISWWAAATNTSNLPDTRIREVLSYSEVNKGWFMDAILITTDGKADTPLKGIIVLQDLVDYLI